MSCVRFALVLGFLVLILSGCSDRPKHVLDEDKMVDVLTDIQLAEAYHNTMPPGPGNPDRNSLIEAVIKKHGITRQELDSTIAYYGRNIDDYYALYEKVENRLRKENGKEKAVIENALDDIWPYSKFTAFMPNQGSDGISFSIPAEDLESGNSLEWSLRLTSADGVEALLGVEYSDGTTSYFKKSAAGNVSLKINLQIDTAKVAERLFGSVTVPQRSRPVWADSIRLVKADFDSMSYSRIRSQRTIYPPKAAPLVEDVEGTVVPDTVNSNTPG